MTSNPVVEREWFARAYRPGDEEGIGALWRTAFPDSEEVGRAELRYWNWQYRDPPGGPARIRVAVKEGEIVGHYAVIPVQMQLRGRAVLGTLSLDTMTHPAYRRQGMLTALASEVYEELGRDGLPITYGFPNENSVDALTRKLGWDYVCALPVYVKPLQPEAIAGAVVKNRAVAALAQPAARLGAAVLCRGRPAPARAGGQVRWLDGFDERADQVWQAAYDRSTNALTRSAAFLNWRYARNPLRRYRSLAFEEGGQPVAYAVLRCMEQFGLRGGMIVELTGRPGREDAVDAVLAGAEEYFRQEKMDLVACLMHGNGQTVGLLRKQGFLRAPRRSFKKWHFCVRVNDDSLARGPLRDPANWYITFGDTDVI